jgi:signal transduction histidine kinase
VRPDAERRPVDIRAVLARLADAVRPQLAATGVRLDVGIADAPPPVLADDTALELALLNLITNAVDAMPGGGELSIRASEGPKGLRLEIRDTGSGIPADLLPKIFDPWVTTKGTRGNGLGLGVTREVVERFGGSITVSSRPGEGALFTIELPGSNPVRASVA